MPAACGFGQPSTGFKCVPNLLSALYVHKSIILIAPSVVKWMSNIREIQIEAVEEVNHKIFFIIKQDQFFKHPQDII